MIKILLWIVILGFCAELSAIGLGRLVVNSALNEPFNAEISIDSIENDALKALTSVPRGGLINQAIPAA